MPLQIKNLGQGNTINIGNDVLQKASGTLTIKGNNNLVEVGNKTVLVKVLFEVRSNASRIVIGNSCTLSGSLRCRADETSILIGDFTTSMGLHISMHEAGSISIGRDCMFSGDIHMDVSDMHSIIDLESGLRINPPKDIVIGDHVWVGQGVYVTKGVNIGQNSVIGAKSVVTKDVPANSLAIGSPARVVRDNITWDRKRLPFEQDRQKSESG